MKTKLLVLPVKIRIKHNTEKGAQAGRKEIREALRGIAVGGGAGDTHYHVEVVSIGYSEHATGK